MAGHSKFKNIMHRKGAQDLKKAKAFSRASKEIIVAVKSGGTDENFNPRLRNALANAKKVNLPKDKIDYAIKKATNQTDKTAYEEIRYEGYGPEGIGIIIETLTDNKNRTASEVRACFSKYACVMASQGGVSYLFDKVVEIIYQIPQTEQDNFYNEVIELDILDCEQVDEEYRVICDFEKFSEISVALRDQFGDFDRYKAKWQPQSELPLDDDKTEKALKLIESLDNLEDTQLVSHNLQLK
jgi:YebC/PmpR family DNA-binding regulatory protein